MLRALPAAYALLAGSCCVLAGVEALHALNAVHVTRALADPAAGGAPVLARDAASVLSALDGVLLLAGCGVLAALAVTRRLDAAHKRAVHVSVSLIGVAVCVDVAAGLVPGAPTEPWGPLAVARALPLLLVPVALAWPHRSARALGFLGASLAAVRVLTPKWASQAYVRASGFTSVGESVPGDLAAWMVLPFAIGALAFTCWAAAFAVVTRRGAREGRGARRPSGAPPPSGNPAVRCRGT